MMEPEQEPPGASDKYREQCAFEDWCDEQGLDANDEGSWEMWEEHNDGR